jgi:FkbM family methyltransferase
MAAAKVVNNVLGHLQNWIGGSSLGLRCAVKLQNQCRAIIGRAHGGSVIDMDENGEAAILRSLGPGLRRVIDVGANVGKWTETALKNSPAATCLMFEPSRLAAAELQKLYGASPRVIIRPVAVADLPSEMTFYEEAGHGETSSLVRSFAAAAATPRIVEITTLDCEIARIGWDLVDYLKIDAEGYDFHVLRGSRRSFEQKRIGLGQFEYGHAWMLSGSTLTCALEWLKELGYESFLLKNGRLYSPRPDFYGEYFGYSNYVFCHSGTKPLISHLITGTA